MPSPISKMKDNITCTVYFIKANPECIVKKKVSKMVRFWHKANMFDNLDNLKEKTLEISSKIYIYIYIKNEIKVNYVGVFNTRGASGWKSS